MVGTIKAQQSYACLCLAMQTQPYLPWQGTTFSLKKGQGYGEGPAPDQSTGSKARNAKV